MSVIFRKIGGRIIPIKVSEMSMNGLKHSNRTIKNTESFLKAYKNSKGNFTFKKAMYMPNGIKDPVRLDSEKKAMDDYFRKQFIDKVVKRANKDEFSQFKAKKSATKNADVVDSLVSMFRGEGNARHFTKKEISKLSQAPMSKRDFYDLLDDKNLLKGSMRDDAANIAESVSRGGIGRKGLMDYFNIRKRDGIRVMREVNSQVPKASRVDRMINARAKGILFKKVNGQLKPFRKK